MSHIATVRTRGGDYRSSTSKDQTRLKTAKRFTHTIHKQHTSKTPQYTRQYPSSNQVLTLGTCGIGPYCFRCATLITEITHRFITSFSWKSYMHTSSVHPLVATLSGTWFISSSSWSTLQPSQTLLCNSKVSINTLSTADKQTIAPRPHTERIFQKEWHPVTNFSNRRKRYDIPTSRNHIIQGLTSKYNLNLWHDLWQSEATFNHTLK